MIKLENAKIFDGRVTKDATTISFDTGRTLISYDDRYIFNFLKIKNAILDDGSFSVNDVMIAPNGDKNKMLYVLSINSKVLSISVSYLINKDLKKSFSQVLEGSLFLLKDMPLTNHEEEVNKIKAIIKAILREELAYVLLDLNNEVNAKFIEDIDQLMLENNLTYLVLDQKPAEESTKPMKTKVSEISLDEEVSSSTESLSGEEEDKKVEISNPDLKIKNSLKFNKGIKHEMSDEAKDEEKSKDNPKRIKLNEDKKPNRFVSYINELKAKHRAKKPIKEDAQSENNIFTFFKQFLRKDGVFVAFSLIFSLFSVFGFSVFPGLLKENNISVASIFLIIGIIFTFMTIYVSSSTYMASKKYRVRKEDYWAMTFFFAFINLLGSLAAFGLLYLLKANNVLFKENEIEVVQLTGAIIVSIIVTFVPLLSKQISDLYNWIKGKIKQKIED